MPDERRIFPGRAIAGFTVGQGAQYNDDVQKDVTIGGWTYKSHVTINSVVTVEKQGDQPAGIKVGKFHVSFKYKGQTWGMVKWSFNFASGRYEIEAFTGECANGAHTGVFRHRADQRVAARCRFGQMVAIDHAAPAPVAAAVIAPPAVPVIGAAPIVAAPGAVIAPPPAVAPPPQPGGVVPGAPPINAGPAAVGAPNVVPPDPVAPLVPAT